MIRLALVREEERRKALAVQDHSHGDDDDQRQQNAGDELHGPKHTPATLFRIIEDRFSHVGKTTTIVAVILLRVSEGSPGLKPAEY